jgi:hypothetical protein
MLKKKETITQNHINKVLLKNYTYFFDTWESKVPKPANFDFVFFTSLNPIWLDVLDEGNFLFYKLCLVLA